MQPAELVLPRGEVSVETRKVARGILRAPRFEELPLGSEGGQVGLRRSLSLRPACMPPCAGPERRGGTASRQLRCQATVCVEDSRHSALLRRLCATSVPLTAVPSGRVWMQCIALHDAPPVWAQRALCAPAWLPNTRSRPAALQFWDAHTALAQLETSGYFPEGAVLPPALAALHEGGAGQAAAAHALGGCLSHLRDMLLDKQVPGLIGNRGSRGLFRCSGAASTRVEGRAEPRRTCPELLIRTCWRWSAGQKLLP